MVTQQVIEAFEGLRGCECKLTLADVQKSGFKASVLLRKLYIAGLSHAEYSSAELQLIDSLIKSAVFALKHWISFTSNNFPPRNNLAHSKRERSGFEFLDELIKNNLKEHMKLISDLSRNYVVRWDKHLEDEFNIADFDIIEYDLSDDEQASIPKSHWWCRDPDDDNNPCVIL